MQNERARDQEWEGRRETEEIWGQASARECVSTAAPPLIENAELESAVQVTRMLLVPGLAVKHQGGEKGQEAGGMKGDASAVTLSPEDPRLGKCLISHIPLFFHILRARFGFCEIGFCGLLFQHPQTLSCI